MKSVRYVGAGAYLPARVVRNERLVEAIPGWDPRRIEERIGIVERRYLWDFDPVQGKTIVPPADAHVWPRSNADMSEIAARRALEMAGLDARELDGLCLVTATPDEVSFCHDAVQVHKRLGCRADAFAFIIDSGCGGAVYAADLVRKLILSGQVNTILLVASNFASAYLDREICTCEMPGTPKINAFLSPYMFGDGAGAVIMRGENDSELGVLASIAGTDHPELVVHRGGGALRPASRAERTDHAWFVDGYAVARAYPDYMRRIVESLRAARPELAASVERFYLHQANKHLLLAFAEEAALPVDRVPVHMDRYGNTSAASTLILFAEDLEQGRVELGSGQLVLFAAVGAGVHYGGQLVRL